MQQIIPIFVMNRGCPHRCIFCNIQKTAGNHPEQFTEGVFQEMVQQHLNSMKRKPDRVQIAFYGGNFTGMKKADQIEMLESARQFIKRGLVDNLRISTRPDNITPECLDMLKKFDVTTVEIGAQSMVDEVLNLAGRGHSSADVIKSMKMLKEWGFETGIHLMVGLPGESCASFEFSVEQIIALQPDTVRIHPTLVLQDTPLEKVFLDGAYTPLTLTESIDLCKFALRRFEEACIPVIRLGLQTTREMEAPGSIIAGPYHPAFRSLVEESLFFDLASSLLSSEQVKNNTVTISVSPKDVSNVRGQKNINLQRLRDRFELAGIHISVDPHQQKRSLAVTIKGRTLKTDFLYNVRQGASIV